MVPTSLNLMAVGTPYFVEVARAPIPLVYPAGVYPAGTPYFVEVARALKSRNANQK